MRTFLAAPLLFSGFVLAQTPTPTATRPSVKERAEGYLETSLRDKNPDTRKQAVQAYGLVGAKEPYLSRLALMLDDKDVEVRLATITSLVDLKNKGTVPALRKAHEDEVPEVSFAAAKALWVLKDPAAREALLSVLSGETKIASGFITAQKREAFRMLHTPRPLFLMAVKTGVGFAPVPGLGEGISSLQGILTDPSVSGRAATALLLGTDKDPRVIVALKDALDDKDASVRAAAVHAIALRNDPSQEVHLVPLLDDKKAAVRLRAAAACIRLELIRPVRKAPAKKPASTKSTAK